MNNKKELILKIIGTIFVFGTTLYLEFDSKSTLFERVISAIVSFLWIFTLLSIDHTDHHNS